MKSLLSLVFVVVAFAVFFTATEARAFCILISTTQLDVASAKAATRLACDGVWFNHFTKPPGFDDDKLWADALTAIGTRHICTEDVYGHVTPKGPSIFNRTRSNEAALRILKRVDQAMTYYESAGSGKRTTMLTAEERKLAAEKLSGGLLMLGRAYFGNWQKEIDEALDDPLCGGVIFEIKAQAEMAAERKIADGLKAVLAKGKKAYVLLAGNHPSENYSADVVAVYRQFVKEGVPMENENVFLVLAAYNVSKTKLSFLGGENSVEGAIEALKRLAKPCP